MLFFLCSSAKLEKSTIAFDQLLNHYIEHLNYLCFTLISICKNKKHGPQQFIWMGPYLNKDILTEQQQNQFNDIIERTQLITQVYSFHLFNRDIFWKRTHEELSLPNSHHLSPKGIVDYIDFQLHLKFLFNLAIRLTTEFLSEIIRNKWIRFKKRQKYL